MTTLPRHDCRLTQAKMPTTRPPFRPTIGEVTVEDFIDGRGEDARSVRKIKFKLADKRGALVDLGRHFALFTDKAVVDVNHGVRKPAEIIARAKEAEKRLGITLPFHLLGEQCGK